MIWTVEKTYKLAGFNLKPALYRLQTTLENLKACFEHPVRISRPYCNNHVVEIVETMSEKETNAQTMNTLSISF